jgi:hypothetical protein
LPQGSDLEEESRGFISAINLYEEKKVSKIKIRKGVTPRFKFNFVNMLKDDTNEE